MREVRDASEKAWEDMQDSVTTAWESIGEGFRKAVDRFR